MKHGFKGTLLVAGMGVGTALPAAAQIDEIVVTAERRESSLQDVPVAITAFDNEDLRTKQIEEPLDLVNYVPNLYGGNNTGLGTANVYYIRGQGNTETIATFDPPVGTYVDEIYLARQNGNNVSFFDVEQIEVLRGPQGTLFGRNTTGGAIAIRMAKPAERLGGFAEVSYGNYDRLVLRGSVDVPLSPGVLTKVSGFLVEDDGWVDAVVTNETLNGQEAWGVRLDARFLPSDTATIDVAVEYSEDESLSILNYAEDGTPFALDGDEADDRISRTGISTERGEGGQLEQLLAGQGLGVKNETLFIVANVGIDVPGGRLNLIGGLRQMEQDFVVDFFDGGLAGQGFATGGFAIANEGQHDQVSLELKYAGSIGERVDLVAGLFAFGEDNETDFADVFTIDVDPGDGIVPFPLLLADRVLDNQLETYAAYAQADVSLTEALTITVGGRVTDEKKEIQYSDNQPGGSLNSAAIAAEGIPLEQSVTRFNPRIVASYDFNADVGVYASATSGFKSGGWNARGTSPDLIQPFGPEDVWSYEVGFRSILLDDTVRFNATAFYMDVEDLQTPSAFVGEGGAITFITRNFADLENKGIELDLTYAPTRALNLYTSLGLQDAEYGTVDPSIETQQAACETDPSQGGLGIVAPDCSIAEPVRVPDTTLTVGGTYEFALGDTLTLTPSLNYRYVSETFTGTSNLPNGFEDGFELVNAGLALADVEGRWSLRAQCRNCFDEAYVTNNLPPTAYLNEPRRYEVVFRTDY